VYLITDRTSDALHQEFVEKPLLPLINADKRGFSEGNIFVFDQRSSAFISGQLGFLILQQAPGGSR
jgi:hypothetical protein